MKIKLVFDDWQTPKGSIYNTPEGVELSLGAFHSGTTFEGEIKLEEGDAIELKEALEKGYQPVFWVYKDKEEKQEAK